MKESCSKFADYVTDCQVLKAYFHIIKLINGSELTCEPRHKNPRNKRSCNLYDNRNMPYAFIVNRKHLTFYFRKYELSSRNRAELRKNLYDDFGKNFNPDPNQRLEYHVELRSIQEVERLTKHLRWGLRHSPPPRVRGC